ncbi:MAG: hypothetical protein MR894_06765, partial [Akkermansia muciniphila]|nr:hypothetical protein [Akkermansia muciniphila]
MIKAAYQVDPCLGRRRLPMLLRKKYGLDIGPKKLMRLKREMQLQTICNRPQNTLYGAHPENVKYPYIVRDMGYLHPNDVWSSDITFVKIITPAMNDCRQPHTPPSDAGIVWPPLSDPGFFFPYAQRPAPSVFCCL